MAKERKQYKPSEGTINTFVYRGVYGIIKPLLHLLFGLKITIDPRVKGLDGPLLLLANHHSYLDALVAAMAVPWRKINFVAGRALFQGGFVGPLLRYVRAIPKEQFYPDPSAITEIFRVLRRGGATLVFPEGQRSIDGGPLSFSHGAAKLIRKSGATCLVVKIKGAGLAFPRWAKNIRRGRVEVSLEPFLTKEEAKALSVEAIHERLTKALEHNEFSWQESLPRPHQYRSAKLAEGLESILYWCPNCDQTKGFQAKKKTLRCLVCQASYRLKPSYRFAAKVFLPYDNPFEWRQAQFKRRMQAYEADGILYQDAVQIQALIPDGELGSIRQGELRVDGTGCSFLPAGGQGAIDFRVAEEGHSYLSLGNYLQLFGDGGQAYRLTPADPASLAKLAEALVLYAKLRKRGSKTCNENDTINGI